MTPCTHSRGPMRYASLTHPLSCYRRAHMSICIRVCGRVHARITTAAQFCVRADRWPASAESVERDDVLPRKQAVVELLRQTLGSLLVTLFTSLWSLPLDAARAVGLLPSVHQLLCSIEALAVGCIRDFISPCARRIPVCI